MIFVSKALGAEHEYDPHQLERLDTARAFTNGRPLNLRCRVPNGQWADDNIHNVSQVYQVQRDYYAWQQAHGGTAS